MGPHPYRTFASEHRMKPVFSFAALLALALIPSHARAALGGRVETVEADRARMKGTVQVRPATAYSVHEIQAPNKVVVREFVSPAGVVFGVGWRGPFVPDMQQLLGTYFARYQAAVQAQKSSYVGRRPLNIQSPEFVVQMNGHMRAYFGRVYLPAQVPQGVKVEELW